MKKIIKERDDIVFFIKMFPLKSHTGAYEKSKAIVCAGSLEALDDAFADKPLPEPTCESTEVDDNLALGEELGISSTPTIILPDGAIVPGYKDADTLVALITQAGDSMETEGAQEPPAEATEETPEGGAEESQP
jgi:thiol:disulfide interchange protein DsbC